MKYVALMTMSFTKDWLALTREERSRFRETRMKPILEQYRGKVGLRYFDAEAFCAEVSDFALFEFEDLKDYYFLMEELRGTELFSKEWMVVKELILGIEGGHEAFEQEVPG
jgi:hypothetical protein